MNKNLLILSSVVIMGIFGFTGYFLVNSDKAISPASDGVMEDDAMKDDEQTAMDSSGSYLTSYSDSSFTANSKMKRVIFFYANWCPTCRPVDKEIAQNADSLPEDLVIYRVNYNDSNTDDTEKQLAKQYGVTYQHTFVLVGENGEIVKKWNGGDLDKILKEI